MIEADLILQRSELLEERIFLQVELYMKEKENVGTKLGQDNREKQMPIYSAQYTCSNAVLLL